MTNQEVAAIVAESLEGTKVLFSQVEGVIAENQRLKDENATLKASQKSTSTGKEEFKGLTDEQYEQVLDNILPGHQRSEKTPKDPTAQDKLIDNILNNCSWLR